MCLWTTSTCCDKFHQLYSPNGLFTDKGNVRRHSTLAKLKDKHEPRTKVVRRPAPVRQIAYGPSVAGAAHGIDAGNGIGGAVAVAHGHSGRGGHGHGGDSLSGGGLAAFGIAEIPRKDWLRLDRAVAVCTGLLVGSYLLELAVLVNNVAETRFTVMAAVLAAGLATRPTDMAGMLVTDLETRPTDLVATKQLTDSAVTRLGCKGLVRLVIDLVAVSFTSAMEAKQCRLVVSYGIRKLDETSTSSYNGLLSVALDPSAYKMAPNMWNHDSGRTTILRQPRVPLS
ncbi:hypothetical protein PI124_g21105 [Phytophthora idaei]|nr:hypothetical protein PI125_g22689 [Phytophthora idaei]KAG3233827.1 hypothetical protein PI124_g21105 [Phytophthora idaei]